MEKIKTFFSILCGYLIAALVAVLWFLSTRRKKPVISAKVAPKAVPDSMDEVEKELKKRGLIK